MVTSQDRTMVYNLGRPKQIESLNAITRGNVR